MNRILDLQKLAVPQTYGMNAGSCTSSWSDCCKTQTQALS
jgi:hypothetical protein